MRVDEIQTLLRKEISVKHIVVIVAGTGKARDLDIEAGTTARDILTDLGLQDYVLSRDSGQDVFGENENVYTAIQDGEKLYASTRTDVGNQITTERR